MPHDFNSGTTVSRRSFLVSAVTGLAAATVFPSPRPSRMTAQTQTGCGYLEDLVKNWDLVRPTLASRYHRLHHVLFHYVRNNWAGLTRAQRTALIGLNWGVPRPSLVRATWDKRPERVGNLFWATDNGSGADFLFYHRWMITMVDQMLARGGKGPVEPWSDRDAIPPPEGGCPDERVPDFVPRFEDPKNPDKPIDVPALQLRVKEIKSPGFFWNKMNWWGQDDRDRARLKTLKMGELGARLERDVHNQMHIRWSAYPSNGYKLLRTESDLREKWDDPLYDTLFDEYSAHINPLFYRLHKWIDNRIEDWAEAHHNEVVRFRTPHGFDWFRPGRWVEVGTYWTGAWGFEHIPPGEEKRRIEIMERVMHILSGEEGPSLKLAPGAPEPEHHIITLRDMVM
ncbi:MAG TPA: hypothetical protein VJX67_08050 [Blastocatellia bacterium]|nr:hypothetical protein [Blastocatellia bacterium]